MKKLASILAAGTLLTTAACTQTPRPQAPQPPPPQPMGASMDCPMMHQDPMMPMHHEEMREHARRPERGPMMYRGGDGRELMRGLAMLGVHLYPPPFILRRAQQIGLTADQISKIRQEMLTMQAHSVDSNAKLEKAKLESIRLLSADKVDQRAVDAQIDEATKASAELRKLHLAMMLHVRDMLTADQLKKLEEHEQRGPDANPGGPGPGKQALEGDDDDDDDDAALP